MWVNTKHNYLYLTWKSHKPVSFIYSNNTSDLSPLLSYRALWCMAGCVNLSMLCVFTDTPLHYVTSCWSADLLTFPAASCSFNEKCNPTLSQTAPLHLPRQSVSPGWHAYSYTQGWHVITRGLFCFFFLPQPPVIISIGHAVSHAVLPCHQQQHQPSVGPWRVNPTWFPHWSVIMILADAICEVHTHWVLGMCALCFLCLCVESRAQSFKVPHCRVCEIYVRLLNEDSPYSTSASNNEPLGLLRCSLHPVLQDFVSLGVLPSESQPTR